MTDANLSDPVREIDSDVVRHLIANHRKFLSFLEKRLSSSAVAEEILQQAFVKAVEHGEKFAEPENSVAWFYKVLRNAIIDHYRHMDAERRALAKEAAEAAMTSEFEQELKDAICECVGELVNTLKPEYAELITEIDLKDRSLDDYVGTAGITRNNATVRLHRARQALKSQLVRSCGSCATHGCLDCHCKK